MAEYKHEYSSVVLLGSFNPVIINHDFLVANQILPLDVDPFLSLSKNEPGKQFSQFFSSPEMTFLKYDQVSVVVDRTRYQIKDDRPLSLDGSPIIGITSRLFSEFLKYTPLETSGINLHGKIVFPDESAQNVFLASLGCNPATLGAATGQSRNYLGIIVAFRNEYGKCELLIREPLDDAVYCQVNFNVERKSPILAEVLSSLDQYPLIAKDFLRMLKEMKVVNNHG
jgi:hypothetical protein